MYTKFEQAIFDRAILNYQNKHGDHLSGINYYYKAEPHKTEYWDEFWDIYLNTEEKLL